MAFFRVVKAGDCCGGRIINEFNTRQKKVYDLDVNGFYKYDNHGQMIIKEIVPFSKEVLTQDIKEVIRLTPNPCFWWIQLNQSQVPFFEEAILAAGFEKVAVGRNDNTGNYIHAYFYNARYRADEKSWQTKIKEKK